MAVGASAKFRWGPTAGVNFGNLYWNQRLIPSDMTVGYQAGVMGEIMIPGIGFGVDLALKYSNIGSRLDLGSRPVWAFDGYGKVDYRIHKLDIPVNLRFKWTRLNGFEQYLAPIVFGGPQLSFNLAGSDCPALKRPTASFGLQCGAGVEIIRRLQITAGYHWGLTYDTQTIKLDDLTARTQHAFINLTWLFN